MYARSTTVRGNAQAMDDEIAFVRDEVMPALQAMSGCVGVSLLCERDGGRCIITSAWADETAMHATEQAVVDLRRRAADLMDGDYETQVWEIAAMHRVRETGDSACARVIWSQGQPAEVDRIVESWRTTIPAQLEQMDGFCGVSVFVDRTSGRAVAAVSYENRDAMNRSAERGLALRDRFAASHGFDITDVDEFDIVLAHLRLPELVGGGR
jgi:quinol monooxygenase YgiN